LTGYLLRYSSAGAKAWSRWSGNNVETRFYEEPYDGLGRLRSVTTVNLAADPDVVITDFRYGYDRVGNRTHEQRIHEPDTSGSEFRTRAYRTDLMGRLEKWREGPLAEGSIQSGDVDPTSHLSGSETDGESWGLDSVGSWTQKASGANDEETTTLVPNVLNQYDEMTVDGTPPITSTFAFDWLGQLREDESKGHTYTWDLFGRLTKVYVNSTLAADYRYDALNRRVEKVVESGFVATDRVTRFIYDGWRAIEERALISGSPESEVVRARYGFGLALDEAVWMDRDVAICPTGAVNCTPGDPDPVEGVPDGIIESRFFLHHDGLGSVAAMTDDPTTGSPTVLERFTYSAYGEVSAWDGDWSPSNGFYGAGTSYPRSRFGLSYLFTGQRLDAESGIHYFKNRLYDPGVGRFMRRDPIGYAAGSSLYWYADGSPATVVDPLGLCSGCEGRHHLPSDTYSGYDGKSESGRMISWQNQLKQQMFSQYEQTRQWEGLSRTRTTWVDTSGPPTYTTFGELTQEEKQAGGMDDDSLPSEASIEVLHPSGHWETTTEREWVSSTGTDTFTLTRASQAMGLAASHGVGFQKQASELGRQLQRGVYPGRNWGTISRTGKYLKPLGKAALPVVFVSEYHEQREEGRTEGQAVAVATASTAGAYAGGVVGGAACGLLMASTCGTSGFLCGGMIFAAGMIGSWAGETMAEGIIDRFGGS